MVAAFIFLIIGLIVLVKGADFLVDGAVALAVHIGVSPLIVGLTIVAMGTSAPEVAASITATIQGAGSAAIGNVYGSNIANLAFIGGFIAIIRPVIVQKITLKRELPAMLIVALLIWPFLSDGFLARADSLVLLVIFSGMMIFIIINALKESRANLKSRVSRADVAEVTETHLKTVSIPASTGLIIIGLVGLVAGAKLTVDSAIFIGQKAGLSEAVIGLTIIAVGTSLPELMTCSVAALKGHDDISIGNLVGSNIFNTLLVIGTAGLVKPFTVSARLIGIDFWTMVGFSALFLAVAVIRKKIGRLAGIMLLIAYWTYMLYLFIFTRTL